MEKIRTAKLAVDFAKWFPKALEELNAHYQVTGCEKCHALLLEAKNNLGVKFVASGGEKSID